jgi:tetratricopeptide (TPR) repeat protein
MRREQRNIKRFLQRCPRFMGFLFRPLLVVNVLVWAFCTDGAQQIPAAQRAYDEGLTLQSQSHYAEASVKFLQAIAINPEFGDAYFQLGSSRLREGNTQEAIKAFIKLGQLEPENQKAILAAADVYSSLELFEDAQTLYYRAAHLNPKSATIHYDLGYVLFRLKRYPEAIGELEKSLALDPANLPSQRLIPSVYLAAGDPVSAEKQLRNSISKDPHSSEFHVELANVLLGTGRANDAEEEYKAAIAVRPDDSSAHLGLAKLYRRTGKPQLALEQVDVALHLDRENSAAFLERGQIEYTLGSLDAAAKDFEEFSHRERERPDGEYLLGLLELTRTQPASAIEHLRKAIEIDPNLTDAYYYLADAYHRSGNDVQAKQPLAHYLQLKPTDQRATTLQATLSNR